jgi:ABC-type lipoprotein export system ATPase subunit
MNLFHQLNEERKITVILVTHDQDVAGHARRIVTLRDGEIIEDTTDLAQALKALHSGQLELAAE